ncbi:MAG: hypothetical protein JOZ62_17895, partial [Acidobacteriaceae bacterium]|nr:hypothetical protein [Acidobacteriaceae bacterium]
FDDSVSRLRRHQFGGTLSGPVTIPHVYYGKDRTFFLFSWESQRQEQGSSKLGVVPTAAQRMGNFTGFGPIKDPLLKGACDQTSSAGCFPRNQIPLSRISPVSQLAEQYFPLPNRPGQVNNYYAYTVAPNNWDSDVIKIDHSFTKNDTVSWRWLKRYNSSLAPFNNSDLGTFGQIVNSHQTLTGLTYTHLFSPVLISESRLGFSRTDEVDLPTTAGTDYNALLGLPSPGDPHLIGFPLFTITNYEKLGNGANLPVHFTVNNFEWAQTLTIVKGKHMIKTGPDFLRTQFFQPYYNNNRGTFNFLGRWTNDPYADFLLGLPDSASHQIGTTTNYMFANNFSAFAQDDWRIASRLTLNLGLRYELPLPMYDKYGRYANFVPELGKLVLADDATLQGTNIQFTDPSKVTTAKQAGLPKSLVFPNYRDFAPRFGLAWRPFGGEKTSVRGGYGIYYGTGLLNDMRNNLANVFPFAISQTFNRNANNVSYLTLSNPFPGPPNLSGNVTNANGNEIHGKTPYLQSWNVTVERSVGFESAIEIGYVGSKGTHLGRYYNINQPFRSAATAPNFPYPYPGFQTINYYGYNANSSYNAGSITFRRRFARDFFYFVAYTYAKSIDDTSQLNGAGAGGYAGAQNVRNLHGERGRSDWDVGHLGTIAFSWTVPWRRNVFIRGWQLAGTGIMRTGQPITPQVNNVNLNLGEANRPDRIAKGTVPDPGPNRWFDIGAFQVVPTGSFRFGNSGRNILDGPGSIAVNTALDRNFNISEKSGLQLRWEVFNVLNHPNLELPVVNVNVPNAATITSAQDPRLMQLGLRVWF